MEWVEKASFDRLNRLFEIAAAKRSCDTLLSAQNLHSVMQELQPYVLNILSRRLPEEVVVGEHFVLQDLSFYAAVQNIDARTRKARLTDREEKRKEGLLRKAPGGKRSTPSPVGAPTKKKRKVSKKGKEVKISTPPKEFVIPPIIDEAEVTIKEPKNPVPPFISSGPGHVAGLNHSGPSLSAAAHLALLAEEAASINQPDSPHLDEEAAEALCEAALPLMATPMEEIGAESQSLPSGEPSLLALVPVKGSASKRARSTRNLKSDLIGGFKIDFKRPLKSVARPPRMIIRRGARQRWQLRPRPSRWWSRMRVRLERPIRLKMRGPRNWRRSLLPTPHQGGGLLMMRLAFSLAFLATRSWKRS